MESQIEIHNIYDMINNVQPEVDVYFYHPDHLGSSSWITYTNGSAVEHLHYQPWGEDFVRQRHTNYHARYTFSGKEKDTETGYSYFGSRYYSSDLSVWLSIDPQSDKYPSFSPYVYCANNPIKLVDPNGEEIGEYYNWKGKYLGWDGHNDDKIYFVHGKKDERILKKANGGPVHPDDVNIDVTTTKQAVREILYVADITSYNGELWEEASYLTTKGRYTDGGPNINCLSEDEDPYVDVNYDGEITVSVHSHLPYLKIKNSDEIKSYSALRPSKADKFIKSTQNIITGPLGDTEWTIFANGKGGFWNTPERGAAFYDGNWNYQGSITISNLRKINIW